MRDMRIVSPFMAALIDGSTGEVKAEAPMQGEPKPKPNYGKLGDPFAFTCTSARKMDGWSFKATPTVLRATVGTVTFQMLGGIRIDAEVVRVQERTIEEGGNVKGVGHLELDFRGKGAGPRTTPAITLSDESAEIVKSVLDSWKAYRDENKYPVPVLVPKADSGKPTTLTVAD